jgi:type I restriction-modification system DNA methylase subunit
MLKEKYLTAHGEEKARYRKKIYEEQSRIASELHILHGEGVIDWQVQFAEVFVKNGGFDIVLTNPPYVRQELIKDIKPKLKLVFPKVYDATADLYVYFYARAVQLLREGGILVFIASNKFFRAGYGEKLRQRLANSSAIVSIMGSRLVAMKPLRLTRTSAKT